MDKLHFVTLAVQPYWTQQTILLLQSLRSFGGEFADAPVSAYTPAPVSSLPQDVISLFNQLSAQILPFEIPTPVANFPLGFIPFAAGQAELDLVGQTEQLAWVLPDTVFVSTPACFILPNGKQFGYRPVHHANIGSDFAHPPDGFWSFILEHCHVPEAHIFPMETCTRDKILRPYVNAGVLITRPENRLLQSWRDHFSAALEHDDLKPLLENRRNAIFLHQAILSGVMIQVFPPNTLYELPETVNYPLHLHHEYPPDHAPRTLNDLITFRYETVDELREGISKISLSSDLKDWLIAIIDEDSQ